MSCNTGVAHGSLGLRQQWIGYNIYKQIVMTVTRIITYYVITSKMGAYMFLIMNLYCNVYCTVHWVIFFFYCIKTKHIYVAH